MKIYYGVSHTESHRLRDNSTNNNPFKKERIHINSKHPMVFKENYNFSYLIITRIAKKKKKKKRQPKLGNAVQRKQLPPPTAYSLSTAQIQHPTKLGASLKIVSPP